MKKIFLSLALTFCSLYAVAESTSDAQKISYADKQIQFIIAPYGFEVIPESVNVRPSARIDMQSAGLFITMLGSDVDISVVNFKIQKKQQIYQGWTYLTSANLEPITPMSNEINNTAKLMRRNGAGSGSHPKNFVELMLFARAWSEEAPTIIDLHLKLVK